MAVNGEPAPVTEIRGHAVEREQGFRTSAVKGRSSAHDRARQVQDEIDRVSLAQALADAEMATARVIDLTERLLEARQQIVDLRGELEELRIEHAQYRAEQERIRSSQAFRLAERLWSLRNALRF